MSHLCDVVIVIIVILCKVSAARLGSHKWDTLVPQQELGAGYSDTCRTFCPVQGGRGHYTHIR